MRSEEKFLQGELDKDNFAKLAALGNTALYQFTADAVKLCQPDSVFVCTDSLKDAARIRALAIETGEEKMLAMDGHTSHYDGYHDQARDKEHTGYLVDTGLGNNINTVDRKAGLAEIRTSLKGTMRGRKMIIRFFCLGPPGSAFAIPCIQITDSPYVSHSEDLLYYSCYNQLEKAGDSAEFFRFLHSEGRLENGVSADVDERRMYIDIEENTVYSVNTQYGGNTIGLKKLAFRLAIRKAEREGWLAEHMFVMGAHGPKDRLTYLIGAFPSACGKTSTAMLEGQTIVGDDLAYLREHDGVVRAVNVEHGIFGIIRDVNPEDDPVIWKVLTNPGEVIFSNVLVSDSMPYWLGDGRKHPESGINHSGQWSCGKRDEAGSEITPSHKNARYTVRIADLSNCDPAYDAPEGVPVSGIIYGGRDSDTCVPVTQAFDWIHGVVCKGASLESETTAATLGVEGVRKFDLMSILDFLSISLGRYIQMHLDFVADLKNPPEIFYVNYFLKGPDGQYLNGMTDKRAWIQWIELRINGDVDAIKGPAGYIPIHEDLEGLFKKYLSRTYTKKDYVEQFSLRIPMYLKKIDRIEKVYRAESSDIPAVLFEALAAERKRLEEARTRYGDLISPFDLEPPKQ